jgi:type I restriction enzyme R subunit
MGVFSMEDEVEPFVEKFVLGVPSQELAPFVDAAAQRFNDGIEWPENGKADFKMKCKQFVRIYSRVAAIMPYNVRDWEKLYWYLRCLIPLLVIPVDKEMLDVLDKIDLSTYGLRQTRLNEAITLDAGESVVDPLVAQMVNAGVKDEELDPLDKIIKEFNEHWFKGWEATPDAQKAKFLIIAKAVVEDKDYQELVVGNPNGQAVDELMSKIIKHAVLRQRKADASLYNEYRSNEDFKTDFNAVVRRMIENFADLSARRDLFVPLGQTEFAMAAEGHESL